MLTIHDIPVKKIIDIALLKIAGVDAKKFLQGQLTIDLESISESTSSLGAHCNISGRIVSFFRLFFLKDAYYLSMPKELIPIAMAFLKKYALFAKITIEEVNHLYQYSLALKSFPFSLQKINEQQVLPDFTLIKISGERLLVISLVPKENAVVDEKWHLQNIQCGIPAIYAATSGKFLPHELDLIRLNAVSFTKGCYLGQEIIARMHYRGKLKKTLLRARTNTFVKLNDDIYLKDKLGGTIVDFFKKDEAEMELLFIANTLDSNINEFSINQSPIKILPFEE